MNTDMYATDTPMGQLEHIPDDQLYKAIITASADGITTTDMKGVMLDVSPSSVRLFGYDSASELLGKSIFECIVPADRIRATAEMAQKLLGRLDGTREYTGLRKDGSSISVEVNAEFIKNALGVPVRMVLSVRDVTQRKKNEAEVLHEQLFSKILIESIPGTFYVLGADGKYVRWNTYQRDEIVGKSEEDMRQTSAIDTIHPDDRVLIQSKIENVLVHGVDEVVEGRVLLKGGPAFRWMLMTGHRMTVDDNIFLIGIGIDMTDRKNKEEEVKTMNSFMVDREVRMSELKNEIADLQKTIKELQKTSASTA
jgi:PAS domain S-box-containing protein